MKNSGLKFPALLVPLFLVSCQCSRAPEKQPSILNALQVVASFSILADMVENIGGDEVLVRPLIQAGEDPHHFEPDPQDVLHLSKADLIVYNGENFDPWMERLLAATNHQAKVVKVTEAAPLIPGDPHCWQDPDCGMKYVENISAALQAIRPEKAADFREREARYKQRLMDLKMKLTKRFAGGAGGLRILTAHASMAYFARAYGIEVNALQGVSTARESSARRRAHLEKLAREKRIHAVFGERSGHARQVRQFAQDSGLPYLGDFHTDSLGPEVNSYLRLLEANAELVLSILEKKR